MCAALLRTIDPIFENRLRTSTRKQGVKRG
jgi:hypothetical protein